MTARRANVGVAGNPGTSSNHKSLLGRGWIEGYRPLRCWLGGQMICLGKPGWGGVGPGLWLSYGDDPPPDAKFNLGLAAQHTWQWWWERRPFGGTDGAYPMALFIRRDLGVTP